MRHPQLVVYDNDGRIAGSLKETARGLKWAFREPRQPEACLRVLRQGSPSVLVLRVSLPPPRERPEKVSGPLNAKVQTPFPGGDVGQELMLLERVAWLFPETKTVLVCDHETELAGLAWDLGADFVLGPAALRDQLPNIVVGLMEAVAGRHAEVVAEG